MGCRGDDLNETVFACRGAAWRRAPRRLVVYKEVVSRCVAVVNVQVDKVGELPSAADVSVGNQGVNRQTTTTGYCDISNNVKITIVSKPACDFPNFQVTRLF